MTEPAFPQPDIVFLGLRIQEPVTTLTDLLVSVVCYYSFYRLHRSGKRATVYTLFKFYFLTMGLATTFGGLIGHAFLYYFGFKWKLSGWFISMLSIALLERAAIMHARPLLPPLTGNFLSVLNIAELLLLAGITLYTLNFFFVEAHAAYGLLLVVFSMELFVYRRTKDAGSRILLIAVGLSALAALVHLTEFSLHTWFNHLDMSHTIMAFTAWVFYQGVERIKLYHSPGT